MTKYYISFLIGLALFHNSIAQSKGAFDGFNYQGTLIQKEKLSIPGVDEQGAIMINTKVNFRFSILKASINGESEYIETHKVKVDEFGVFNVVVGKGNAIKGRFTDIDWEADNFNKFLKVEVDLGDGYSNLSTMQMFSVPFSILSNNIVDEAITKDKLSKNGVNKNQILKFDGSNWQYSDIVSISNSGINSIVEYNEESLLKNIRGNTAFGVDALKAADGTSDLTSESENTAFGFKAMQSYNGNKNTAIGYEAGYNSSGDKNIFIGYQAGKSLTTSDNKLIIDNQNRGTNSYIYGEIGTFLRFNTPVNVNNRLTVRGGTAGVAGTIEMNNGDITASSSITSSTISSTGKITAGNSLEVTMGTLNVRDGGADINGDIKAINITSARKITAGNSLEVTNGNLNIKSGAIDIQNTGGYILLRDGYMQLTKGNLTLQDGGADINGDIKAINITSARKITAGNQLEVTRGNLNVKDGNIDMDDGDLMVRDGNININDGDFAITKGNITSTDGNMELTKGHLTLKKGNLTLDDGDITVIGDITATGTVTWSDKRYKEGIKSIPDALSKVKSIEGVSYSFKKEFTDKGFPKGKQIGVIAQNIEKVLPELVKTNKDGYKGVNYSQITAVLIEAIKELSEKSQKEIKKLNKKLKKQAKEIEKLKKDREIEDPK